MRVAIVHDYLMQLGGAERVVQALHELYPEAPIYTSVYSEKIVRTYFPKATVHASFLQKIVGPRTYKHALSLYPSAFESFDLRNYDVVLSSTSSFAKGVITPPEVCHVCYCHTPSRFAWRNHEYIGEKDISLPTRILLRAILLKLRMWDVLAAKRVDFFVANSKNIARRIQTFYQSESVVIEPPVDISRFHVSDQVNDNFLICSRLIRYKQIDLAIEACNRLKLPLVIIGTGPDEARLKAMAGPTVRFLNQCTDREVAENMATCKALIFPGDEDFGVTPLEAMASGRPVIALNEGGAKETVLEGVTGMRFKESTVESLMETLTAFKPEDFDRDTLLQWAERFSVSNFQARIAAFVDIAAKYHAEKFAKAGYAFPVESTLPGAPVPFPISDVHTGQTFPAFGPRVSAKDCPDQEAEDLIRR